jgi:hypothetical protein
MNFSNFFIDVLSGNEPSLSVGSQKSTSPAFLFSDIMKVCDAESIGSTTSTSTESTKEIFSAADSVINIQQDDFEALCQLIASLINTSGNQQPTVTNYDVDEVKITKQQFIIPENKLVDLLGELIEKGNYPLGPFINQLQTSESNKPISLSFKSGSDKLTISFNPIKVDENYTNKIISDEYGFVNKLIVKEGLFINNPAEESSCEKEVTVNEMGESLEKQLETEDATRAKENIITDVPNQIFFRTEIVKIINTAPTPDALSSEILPMKGETTISTFLAYKNYLKENKPVAESSENVSNVSDTIEGTTNISADKATKNSVQTNLESEYNNSEPNPEVEKIINQLVSEQDADLRKNVSISSLMEGLSDEEKSVFKNFASTGELKEITFTTVKTTQNNITDENDTVVNELQDVNEEVPNQKTTTDVQSQENTKIFVKMSVKSPIKIDVKPETIENVVNNSVVSSEDRPNLKEVVLADSMMPVIQEKKSDAEKNGETISNKNTNAKTTLETENGNEVKTNVVSSADRNTAFKINENADSTKEVKSHIKSVNEVASDKNFDINQNVLTVNEKKSLSTKPDSNPENISRLSVKEETSATTRESIEAKVNNTDDAKSIKHVSQNDKANLTSDDNSSKNNSHDSFKSSLTQALSNDFDVEKTKAFSDTKILHEPVKIIKQNEIIPEFSKLIQRGEKQTMTFQISPENLGKVKLVVDMVNNQIQTKIEVESEQIKQFIQSNVEQLKQNLQASGIQLSNVNISLTDYGQKNAGKMFTSKKKSNFQNEKEIPIEEITNQPMKKMGYSTYEFLA